jgi:hypothetical protein
MRVWLLLAMAALTGAPAPAQEVVAFATALPAAVVDVRGWETITGEFETDEARGAYRFHVNPRLQAIYQVMRYRVELLTPQTRLQRQRRSAERVVFIRQPGAPEPMRCWELNPVGHALAWRELRPSSDEYKLEMALLMQVISVHRAARMGEPH